MVPGGSDGASNGVAGLDYFGCELPSLDDHKAGFRRLEEGDQAVVIDHLVELLLSTAGAMSASSKRARVVYRTLEWARALLRFYRSRRNKTAGQL